MTDSGGARVPADPAPSEAPVNAAIPNEADTSVYLYQMLKGARERLCRAQMLVSPDDADVLQGALDRIDLIGCDLPGWSRHDGGRA